MTPYFLALLARERAHRAGYRCAVGWWPIRFTSLHPYQAGLLSPGLQIVVCVRKQKELAP